MDALTHLTPAELEDLKLCGITEESQLQQASAAAVWADLQKVREFFPKHCVVLTEARLQELCRGSETPAPLTTKLNEDLASWDRLVIESTHMSTAGFKRRSRHKEEEQPRTEPEETPTDLTDLPVAEQLPKIELRNSLKKAEKLNGLSKNFHAIRCNRPFSTYFGAWAAIMLIPAIASMVITPILLLCGWNIEKTIIYGVIAILLGVPHLILSRMALCSVCHMRVYTFSNYVRNRAAHKLPLLGHTLATALHVILFFQFRCPACGTQMKLIGRRKGKPHFH